jgi:hypothetical protein
VVGQRADERLQHARGGHVESRERLVEDDDARIVEHRGGDQDLLAHALRVLRERLVAVVPEAQQLKKLIDLGRETVVRDSSEPADQLQVFRAGQIGIEMRLLGHVAERRLVGKEIGEHVASIQQHSAVGRCEQSREHLDRGAFAGSIRAEEAKHFTRTYFEREIADRGQRTIAFAKVLNREHGR